MKLAAIIPVKPFSSAKTRLNLAQNKKEELCKAMLEEVVRTVSMSPQIERTVIVTRDGDAERIGKRHDAHIVAEQGEGVNCAVAQADSFLLDAGFDASIVLPQDIPYIKTQDIDFILNYRMHPNFAIIVPSRRFDGTNALVRMPIDLMETHYDEDSYKIHMNTAKKHTLNAAMVFVKRVMWDVDSMEDLEFLLGQPEKPDFAERIRGILGSD